MVRARVATLVPQLLVARKRGRIHNRSLDIWQARGEPALQGYGIGRLIFLGLVIVVLDHFFKRKWLAYVYAAYCWRLCPGLWSSVARLD